MATTFLESLTQPNPIPDSKCGEGESTKIPIVYGPHKVQPWTDVTWENLIESFGDVLRGRVDGEKVKDRDGVNPEKLVIYTEGSVTSLGELWNEELVQKALDGTRNVLMKSKLKRPLLKGALQFKKNNGQGNIADEKGNWQQPDWAVYQKREEDHDKTRYTNIVPGDSKPASKWKSDWINSEDAKLERYARLVMQQLTKYMYLGNTRYGFVISEEELVPLRLSTFRSDMNTASKHVGSDLAQHMLNASRGNLQDRDEDDSGEYRPKPEIDLEPQQKLAPYLQDANNNTRLLVEYCRIPWTNYGPEKITVNLALWWLPMLAIQDSPVKETGTCGPLSNSAREIPPSFRSQQSENEASRIDHQRQTRQSRKRKAESSNRPMTRSMSRCSSVNYGETTPLLGRSSGLTQDDTVPRTPSDGISYPDGMFSRPPKKHKNKGKSALPVSSTSAYSSQATSDGEYQLSFARSLG